MTHFSFSLEVEGFTEDSVDSIYEAGCDDCLIAMTGGKTYLDFDREATSYGDAVASAVLQIQKLGGTVVDIERIQSVLTPEEAAGKVVDVVQHYAENVDRYVGSVVRGGRMFLARAKSLTQSEPPTKEPSKS